MFLAARLPLAPPHRKDAAFIAAFFCDAGLAAVFFWQGQHRIPAGNRVIINNDSYFPILRAVDSHLARNARFASIYKDDHPWLERRLRDGLRNREDAQDVASETFTQLLQAPALHQLHEPRAMLVTIARRITWRLWRRRELERAWLDMLRIQPELVEPSAESRYQTLQALQALDAVLDGLSSKARMAFLYSQLDGMTHVDIAGRLDVSPTMVRKYIAQALQRCCAVFDA
ncbi:sigma-70 family RNA polymerase sigma factor [Achromobacter xylosoxidans]